MAIALGDDLDINFKVGNDQVDRIYLGSSFVWPQHPIDDFKASDNLVGALNFTWTDSNSPLPHTYDLYEHGNRIYTGLVSGQTLDAVAGTATYHIRSIYEGGHGVDSNEDEGTSLTGIAPGPITDFQASDNQTLQIQFWWTNATGDPVPTYDLYQAGNPLRSGVVSGHIESMPPGTWSFHVKAKNAEGDLDSNADNGTALDNVIPPTYYEAEYATPGTHQFLIPPGVTSVDVCCIGAGGAGGGAEYTVDSYNPSAGGGYAGGEQSGSISVTPGATLTVVVGNGGKGKDQNSAGVHNGEAGTNSRIEFEGITGAGGAGGIGWPDYLSEVQGYKGMHGAGKAGCGGGGHPDGNFSQFQITSVWTGWGGESSSAGRGGDGYGQADVGGNAGHGTRGGGGGGSSVARTVTSFAGNGGDGYVKISWYAIKKEGED